MGLNAVQTNMLVILGDNDKNTIDLEQLNTIVGEEYFTDKNTLVKDSVSLCMCKSSKQVAELVKQLKNIKIGGTKLEALSLQRYLAMYNLGKTSLEQKHIFKPAVKKVIGEDEVKAWKAEALGEQFIIYTEDTISNYQLSKMFPCRLIKSKSLKSMDIDVIDELIIAQKQKNIFVYGGYLELLDGFVVDDILSYYTVGAHIVIGSQPSSTRKAWDIYNIYSKVHVKSVEIDNEAEFSISNGITHYMVSYTGRIEVKSVETDENIFEEYSTVDKNVEIEGFMSEYDNVLLVIKRTPLSTELILHCLTTGHVIRRKIFSNMESYSVKFFEKEVSIVNVRKIGDKKSHFMDIWNLDGNTVISKTFGEHVKTVHPSRYTVVVQTQTTTRIFKRVQNRLLEGTTIKESISKIVPGEITVLSLESAICVIGRDGEVINRIEASATTDVQVSSFGLYIALLSGEQVRVLDICGKEVFAANIKRDNGFFWRTIIKPTEEISLADEEIQKYKAEDTLRRREARKQFMRENEEKISEWRIFLKEMKGFRDIYL